MGQNSPLSNWLRKLPEWQGKFDHDLRTLDFDVIALATLLINNPPPWLRPCRTAADFPNFDASISEEFPYHLEEITSQVRLSPVFLFLIENNIAWRFDGYRHRRTPIIYFRSAADRARFMLTAPSSILSYF